MQSAQMLAKAIWKAETNSDIPPDVLEKIVKRSIQSGKLSFRRVVQAIVPLVAKGK
jgi:hypothetical protein